MVARVDSGDKLRGLDVKPVDQGVNLGNQKFRGQRLNSGSRSAETEHTIGRITNLFSCCRFWS